VRIFWFCRSLPYVKILDLWFLSFLSKLSLCHWSVQRQFLFPSMAWSALRRVTKHVGSVKGCPYLSPFPAKLFCIGNGCMPVLWVVIFPLSVKLYLAEEFVYALSIISKWNEGNHSKNINFNLSWSLVWSNISVLNPKLDCTFQGWCERKPVSWVLGSRVHTLQTGKCISFPID
jgi:hypothetical protein